MTDSLPTGSAVPLPPLPSTQAELDHFLGSEPLHNTPVTPPADTPPASHRLPPLDTAALDKLIPQATSVPVSAESIPAAPLDPPADPALDDVPPVVANTAPIDPAALPEDPPASPGPVAADDWLAKQNRAIENALRGHDDEIELVAHELARDGHAAEALRLNELALEAKKIATGLKTNTLLAEILAKLSAAPASKE